MWQCTAAASMEVTFVPGSGLCYVHCYKILITLRTASHPIYSRFNCVYFLFSTDFEAMAEMVHPKNVPKEQQEELEAYLQEMRNDYNQKHFVRNEKFKLAADKLSGETRKIFIEFLERSCTAEFSGFLLFKELARRLRDVNPVVAGNIAGSFCDHILELMQQIPCLDNMPVSAAPSAFLVHDSPSSLDSTESHYAVSDWRLG